MTNYRCEIWKLLGKIHRVGLPAAIEHNEYSWWLNGVQVDCFAVLPLKVKILIASADERVWILMYMTDDRFKEYATSGVGPNQFVKLFTVKTQAERDQMKNC